MNEDQDLQQDDAENESTSPEESPEPDLDDVGDEELITLSRSELAGAVAQTVADQLQRLGLSPQPEGTGNPAQPPQAPDEPGQPGQPDAASPQGASAPQNAALRRLQTQNEQQAKKHRRELRAEQRRAAEQERALHDAIMRQALMTNMPGDFESSLFNDFVGRVAPITEIRTDGIGHPVNGFPGYTIHFSQPAAKPEDRVAIPSTKDVDAPCQTIEEVYEVLRESQGSDPWNGSGTGFFRQQANGLGAGVFNTSTGRGGGSGAIAQIASASSLTAIVDVMNQSGMFGKR